MKNPYRPTEALIHSENLISNLKWLRSLQKPGAFFCPMVKANGYGHGDVEVAQILVDNGVERLGVGLIEEGEILRRNKIPCEILFLEFVILPGCKRVLIST